MKKILIVMMSFLLVLSGGGLLQAQQNSRLAAMLAGIRKDLKKKAGHIHGRTRGATDLQFNSVAQGNQAAKKHFKQKDYNRSELNFFVYHKQNKRYASLKNLSKVYHGDQLFLHVTVNRNLYSYIVSIDSNNKLSILSFGKVLKNRRRHLIPTSKGITISNKRGYERFYVILAHDPIGSVEEFLGRYPEGGKTLSDKEKRQFDQRWGSFQQYNFMYAATKSRGRIKIGHGKNLTYKKNNVIWFQDHFAAKRVFTHLKNKNDSDDDLLTEKVSIWW